MHAYALCLASPSYDYHRRVLAVTARRPAGLPPLPINIEGILLGWICAPAAHPLCLLI